jgi:PAS domain S-box-containing protein
MRVPFPFGRRRLPGVLLIGAGLILNAAAFTSLRRAENQRIEVDFKRHSTVLMTGFQRLLEDRLAALRALASFDAASIEVPRDEFRTFAASIRADLNCIQALEWVPRVSEADRPEYERAARAEYPLFRFTERNAARELVAASRRAEYFPVYFLEPYGGNEAALGFDLASDATRKTAMDKARDTESMVVTERLGLIQDPGRQRGFLALMPVYRKGLPRQTVAERRANLKGFELAVFRIDGIVDSWRSRMPLEGIAFVLSLRSDSGDDTVLFASNEWSPSDARQALHVKTFELAGRRWSLQFQPSAAYLAGQRSGYAWTVLLAGLVFVVLLGALLTSSAVHTDKIERAGRELKEALSRTRLAQKEAALLDAVMQKINVGVGLGQILDYVFESFDAIIPYDRIGWAVIEHDGRSVRARWARSKCGSPMIRPDYNVPLASSSLRFIVESGTPRIIQDLEAYLHDHPGSESTRLLVAEGMRSNLTCPLIAVGKAVGFLFFSSTRRGTYRPEHVQTFMRIANQLSQTVQKGRLYDEVGEELHKTEERFALAVRGTDAGIWDWDLLTGRVYFSPRWKSMLGYAEDEVEGRFEGWERLLHPQERDRAGATLRDYLEGRSPAYELEHRLRHKDGTYRWIVARGATVCDVHGKPYRMVGSHIDVTDRKLAEESLRETRAQLLGAQKIQQHLLPKAPPDIPGLDIAGACYPSSFAAGDYFDYLTMDDGSLILVVADVMGHGFGPALLAATLQAYLRSIEGTSLGIEHMAASLNRLLLRAAFDGRFVTLILVRLDPKDLTVHYVNAGHPSGYIIDDSGAVKAVLDSTSLPLGVEPGTAFIVSGPVPLAPGDLLVLITDGAIETLSPDDRQFGIRRVLELVSANRALSANDLILALRDAATRYSERIGLLDDLTAIVLKIQKAPCGAAGQPEPTRPDALTRAIVSVP